MHLFGETQPGDVVYGSMTYCNGQAFYYKHKWHFKVPLKVVLQMHMCKH